MLNLGDSYTIGELVTEEERFPNQTIELLKQKNIFFSTPKIIATTGWTTDELQAAIDKENLQTKFDFVTLLIGVNNEFRKRDTGEYRKQFSELLQTAISFADGNKKHVFVISIPDWGITPFAEQDPHHRTEQQISSEIDVFNKINFDEANKQKVNYIEITNESRDAKNDSTLLASDELHPSGKMYSAWAKKLASGIEDALK